MTPAKDAEATVDRFIYVHRQAAIPALIGACVMWAVENGGGDLIRSTLDNAKAMSVEMDAIRKRNSQ